MLRYGPSCVPTNMMFESRGCTAMVRTSTLSGKPLFTACQSPSPGLRRNKPPRYRPCALPSPLAAPAKIFVTPLITMSSLRSIALEYRLLLVRECVIRAMKILRLHAYRLAFGFGFDGLIQAHVPFLVQQLFGHAVREGRAVGEVARHLL